MKTLSKWLARLGAVIVLLAVALVVFRNPILRALAEWRLQSATGMDARIGYLNLSLVKPVVRLENIKLYNPPEFGGLTFIDVPELYAEYDRGAALGRRVHFKLVRMHLAEMNVIENKDGRTNLELLRRRQPPGGTNAAPTASASTNAPAAFSGIDTLDLTLGRIRYTSSRSPNRTTDQPFDIQHRQFKGLKTPGDFAGALVSILPKTSTNYLTLEAKAGTNCMAKPAPKRPSGI